jgi:NitT/TauT family transport system permease protein
MPFDTHTADASPAKASFDEHPAVDGAIARSPMIESAKLQRWYRLHRESIGHRLLSAGSIGIGLLCWHLLTVNKVDAYVRFENVPSPADVIVSIRKVLSSSVFTGHILVSTRRILLGFVLAAAVAIPTGLLIGRFKLLRAVLFPIAEIVRPIPAIAWVPMAIMLWPTSEESILFITFLGSFFPILLNTLQGVESVDPVLVRAARSLGASERAVFLEVYLPGALPQIFTGLTIGMGVAWVSLIAAEMISGQFGVGYFTWQAYSLVDYPDIALGMLTIGLLGLVSSWAIRAVGDFLMPWRTGR